MLSSDSTNTHSLQIIAPGSRFTHAQLGLPESFTPARNKFKSRMFPAERPEQWEPHKIRKKPKKSAKPPAQDGDVSMTNGAQAEVSELEEDVLSDEGAVWPIQAGRIVNWSCFFALLQYIHNTLSPTLHTPILMIAEPAWTAKDHEKITQYCFESFKCPGFVLLDAAQAACYAFALQSGCVIDVGADKANVTTISDYLVDDSTRAVAIPDCGGEAMTKRLQELLSSKGFTRDMCEQLKRSPICEILPPGVPLPGPQTSQNGETKNAAAAASTGADGPGADQRHTAGALGEAPRGPGAGTELGGDNGQTQREEEDNEGVLDVANIVASGKMNEYLARKEKEKQDKAAAKEAKKKGGDSAKADASKTQRLKNSEKEKASFWYEDNALLETLKNSDMDLASAKAALDEGPNRKTSQSAAPPTLDTASATTTTTAPPTNDTTTTSPTTTISPTTTKPPSLPTTSTTTAPRRELTLGPERFLLCTSSATLTSPLLTLSSAIHRVISTSPHPSLRPDLWNNLIILGNGASVRGFKEALLATLQARFLVNPNLSSVANGGSMFMGELPATLPGTPSVGGTGANTPMTGGGAFGQSAGNSGSFMGGAAGASSGANPLLVAATSANAQAVSDALASQSQHNHNPAMLSANLPPQTPSSIRLARLPEYFPEWKEVGSDEAAFLGAQIAAKMVFVVDQSQAGGRGYMTRSDYNEQGPGGIHEFSM